jgi:hypothetical protein
MTELRLALDATRTAIGEDTTVELTYLHESLRANLKLKKKITELVTAAGDDGGTALTSDGLFDAIAFWILDLQLAEGLLWCAEKTPEL